MGVYSNNRIDSIADVQVEAATGYDDVTGVQIAMIESYQNDLAIFEGTIRNDMQEASMKAEGLDEGAVMSFSEGAISDLVGKIKAFFVKLWAKIKGIFTSFMANFDSVFMKSNKEFVNKYKKDVFSGKDLHGLKVKIRPHASGAISGISKIEGEVANDITPSLVNSGTIESIEKEIEDFNQDEYICSILNKTITPALNLSSASDYDKDATDALYDDAEEVENPDVNPVATKLLNSDAALKDAKKAKVEMDKLMSKIVSNLQKAQTETSKKFPVGANASVSYNQHDINDDGSTTATAHTGNKEEISKYQKALSLASRKASAVQTAMLKFTGFVIKITKFEISQNRKIFAAAVAYHRKKNESSLIEGMMELADHEMDVVYGE